MIDTPSNAPQPDLPHFSYPFTFAVVEQDSLEEIEACVSNIVACPQGFLDTLPTFGIPDPTFSTLPLNTDAVREAIEQWEPRASVTVATAPTDDPASQQVIVDVQIAVSGN